jgi:hypothetical protein
MKTLSFFLSSLVPLFLLGCGGSVDVPRENAETASGDSAGSSTGPVISPGTPAKGDVCHPFIDVSFDGGALQHLIRDYPDEEGPSGYILIDYEAKTLQLRMSAIGEYGKESLTTLLVTVSAKGQMGLGSYSEGTAAYTDMAGDSWINASRTSFQANITRLEVVGGIIEGTFSTTVAPQGGGDDTHPLEGTFLVCRAMDVDTAHPPPPR